MNKIPFDKVKETISQYSAKIKDPLIYFTPKIPEKKLRNAVKAYAPIEEGEQPLVLLDDTFYGHDMGGVLLTDRALYGYERVTGAFSIQLNEIWTIEFISEDIKPRYIQGLFINHEPFFTNLMIKNTTMVQFAQMISDIAACLEKRVPVKLPIERTKKPVQPVEKIEKESGENKKTGIEIPPVKPSKPQVSIPWRTIRVFISSTFRDMQAEREELVKRIFPQLRKLCEKRGVTWGEVDLRWGVTDEQKAEGKVLPICLEEIQKCRPYFIGLLGERYGWVPDEIAQDIIQREPWLSQHLHHSVTELEILHGVLNNPEMAEHAFFYFRDAEASKKVEVELAKKPDYKPESGESLSKLESLKKKIEKSGFPVIKDFPDPKTMGELVLKDLTGVINRLYPAGSLPDPLDREAMEHEAYAASRARVYIERKEYFNYLDKHAEGKSPPLVILGESGCGKSALLSNWALKYRESINSKNTTKRQPLVFMHFIGASSYSTDWAAMLRRIMGEFKRNFDIKDEIPNQTDALRAAFANWLHMAAAKNRVILIFDGLNQLEDRDGAPDLVWLPPNIPENIRLILSTLPGRPLDELKKRGWPTLAVTPLNEMERKTLITQYLEQYRKSLSQTQTERIAKATPTANPLYMRVLLEELRVYGDHETLNERIGYYLEAKIVSDLYRKVLKRYEEDYERDRPGLVKDAMSLLWAARRGLSEAELMELLGLDGQPLPRAIWSPLYLAAEQSLISHSGLIGFGHDYLRQAVKTIFLPNEKQQKAIHLHLADYFEEQGLGQRKTDELPWQLAQANSWQRLYDLLANLEFFKTTFISNQFEVKAYWVQIEKNSSLRILKAYQPILDEPHRDVNDTWYVSMILDDMGYRDEALTIRAFLVDYFRQTGNKDSLESCLEGQAVIFRAKGELDAAMALHQEAEHICRELGNEYALQGCLYNQAAILYDKGELNAAMDLFKEQERICRELGNKDSLESCLGGQAIILHARGELDAAMALHKEEERICRELGDKDGLQSSLGHQANILYDRGELDAAMALHQEEERICRDLGNKDGLQNSLNNQALILRVRGELDAAMELLKEQEHICRELGKKDGLQRSLGSQGTILYARGELDAAMDLFKEEERICRDLGKKNGLQESLSNQALILHARGELDAAMELLKEQERICRDLGNKYGLQSSLNNQGIILRARGDLDAAMALHQEAERNCRDLGNKDGLQNSLGHQANILHDKGELDTAVELLKEQERICRELGKKDVLQRSLGHQALILYDKGELDAAMALHQEEERICRDLGKKDGLQRSLGHQANILYDKGELDAAVELLKEQERICRELGNKYSLQDCLGNQAAVFYARGELDAAMALHQEEERICRDLGKKDGLQKSLGHQALILYARKELDDAMNLFKKQEHICRELGDKDSLQSSLGSQANILYDKGEVDNAMDLLKEQERICRELGNKYGLVVCLMSQARVIGLDMKTSRDVLPIVEEAYKVASSSGYVTLAERIKSILAQIR